MAEETGGRYFRARSLPELEMIYDSINQLEPIEQEGQFYRPVTELYAWPGGLAVMLWLAMMILRAGFARHPSAAQGASHG
jgi:Ca-activated chloride channel family protein